MRASFPLFQMIYNGVAEDGIRHPDEDIQAIRSRICRRMRDMDDYQMELVYAIIRCYHLQIDNRSIFEIPYKIKKVKTMQYRVDVDNLPDDLVRILDRFADMQEQVGGTSEPGRPCTGFSKS